MDSNYDVPDSTDWLNTPLQDFAQLENALHCQICKEFYDTPMITSCNHTFCSKCIRTSLSSDGKCPACRAGDQASKLRNNWALQEVVGAFLVARPRALEVARQEPKRQNKRKRVVVDEEDGLEERTTRSKSRRIAASQPEPIEIEDSEDEEIEEELEPDDGRVACPLGCGKRMKEEEVFGHLDRCEDEKKQAASRSRPRTTNTFGTSRPSSSQTQPKSRPSDRINELNYSMAKETALSKKLKDTGIPNWGTKQQMISRHKEWVNIWNANCDSTKPRTKRDLLHDLDVWERTQGGRAPAVYGAVMRKDFDGDAHARRHQDEFSRLIADARRKKKQESAPPPAETKDEEMKNVNGEEARRPSSSDIKPYENNPEAISSIRQKVESLNSGQPISPVMNRDFSRPSSSQQQNPPSTSQPEQQDSAHVVPSLRRDSSKDEHLLHERTGSPCDIPAHLQSAETKKVPMFEVSGRAVTDIDGGGG